MRSGLFPLAVAVVLGFAACDETDPNQTGTGMIVPTGGTAGGTAGGITGGAADAAAG